MRQVERTTNHDVKAVEYVLKEAFEAHPELQRARSSPPSRLPLSHLARGSWDIPPRACTHTLMQAQA